MRRIILTIFFFGVVVSTNAGAEIKIYEDTDNTGNNKYERIGIIEKYLINLSQSLKSMEEKLEANSNKLKFLEENLKKINDKELALRTAKINEVNDVKKKDVKDNDELEKLKRDILSIKNDDVEKMKNDIEALRLNLKQLERGKAF